ncbi:hypothetical protein ACE41H_15670 [Paenibacillus enshidis]|uniref:Uncharacterized protein n=1 Tax=Paenibacillus enshidis TaxID=1458439 RepID=A0ABV5AVH1_9BACL
MKMVEECRAMIKRKARLAALATLIPIPGIDVFTDVVLLKQSISYIDSKFERFFGRGPDR